MDSSGENSTTTVGLWRRTEKKEDESVPMVGKIDVLDNPGSRFCLPAVHRKAVGDNVVQNSKIWSSRRREDGPPPKAVP